MTSDKDKKFAAELKNAARKLWLAGLGTLAAAKDAGTKVFENLVDRGAAFEKRNRPRVTRTMDTARGKVKDAWGKVGHGLDQRVSGVLEKTRAPARKDLESLARRVERLSDNVEELQGSKAPARKRSAVKKSSTGSRSTRKKKASS